MTKHRVGPTRRRLAWACFLACLHLQVSACDVYHPEAFEGYDAGVDAAAPDAGARIDAGTMDAGMIDSDSGLTDSGPLDSGLTDSGAADAEVTEAGIRDATADPDAGAPGDAG